MAIGGFFGGIFSGIDSTFIFWVIAFLILLGVTNFVFTRFMKKQKMLGTIIAILISIAIVYYSSQKYPSFLDNVFYGLGIDPGQILSILPWIGIGLAVLIVAIWGFRMLFMVAGGILIFSGLTGLAYERTAATMIGIILFLIGAYMWYRKKRDPKGPKPPKGKDPPKEKGKAHLIIKVIGNGMTNPHPGKYKLRQGKKITVQAKNPQNIDHWKINGANYGKRKSITLRMNIDYKVIAVFKGGGEEPEEEGKKRPRYDILKNQAIAFKSWTTTQSKPKFYQSWSYFISWLKRKGYGNSEAEIINNLNVTKRDIIKVVRKYILK